MSSFGPRGCVILALVVSCVGVRCGARGTTRLCEGFQSYQTPEEVRAELAGRGVASGWEEKTEGTAPDDRRPPYKFTHLSGPLQLSGIAGRLTLTFYNGRLMETRFLTEEGNDYIAALRNQGATTPQKPGEEVVLDRRTKFRFDIDANGNTVFTWYDPKLMDEWKDWIKYHA